VTEVHWRIIANLGFKFRSHFTAHCGRRAAGGRRAQWRRAACRAAAGRSSRAMLASVMLIYNKQNPERITNAIINFKDNNFKDININGKNLPVYNQV